MSLPVPVKTWQFQINKVVGSTGNVATMNQLLIFELKRLLMGFASNPMIMHYSCNSVTAGTAGDGVDRWPSVANVVRSTGAGATGVRSWAVLKQAGLTSNFQVLIQAASDASAAGGVNYVLSVIVSPSAGFTGGSTTVRPTATDEIPLAQLNVWGGSSPGTGRSHVIHAMQSTDGQLTRVVFLSQSVAWAALILDKPANTPASGWANPFCAAMLSSSSGAFPGPPTALTQAVWSTPATTQWRTRIGGTPVTGTLALTSEGTTTLSAITDTDYGHLANELDGTWPIWPLGIACTTVGARGRVGTMVDLWAGSNAVATGDTYDATSKGFVQFGQLIFPWDGATVPQVS